MLNTKSHQLHKKYRYHYLLILFVLIFSITLVGCEKTTVSTDTTVSVDWDKNKLYAPLHTVELYYGYSTWEPLNYIRLVTEESLYLGDITVSGYVDVTVLGEYDVTYSIELYGEELSDTVTFIVIDNVAPSITFTSDSSKFVYDVGGVIDLMSVITSVDDNYDSLDISNVEIVTEIDAMTAGEYDIIFRITDLSGNYRDYIKTFVVMGFTPETIITHLDGIEILKYIHLDNGDDLYMIRYQNLDRLYVFHDDEIAYSKSSTIGVTYILDYFDSTHVFISEVAKNGLSSFAVISVYDTQTQEESSFTSGNIYQISTNQARYSERDNYTFILKDGFDLYHINQDLSLSLIYDFDDDVVSWDVLMVDQANDLTYLQYSFIHEDGTLTTLLVHPEDGSLIQSYNEEVELSPKVTCYHELVLLVYPQPEDILNPYRIEVFDQDGRLIYSHSLIQYNLSEGNAAVFYQSESTRFVYSFNDIFELVSTYSTKSLVDEVHFDAIGNGYVLLSDQSIEWIHPDGTVTTDNTTVSPRVLNTLSEELFAYEDNQVYTVYNRGEKTTFSCSKTYTNILRVETPSGDTFVLYSDVSFNQVEMLVTRGDNAPVLEQTISCFDHFNYVNTDMSNLLFISSNEVQTIAFYLNADTLELQSATINYSLDLTDNVRIVRHDSEIIILSNKGMYIAPYNDFNNELQDIIFDAYVVNVYLLLDIAYNNNDFLFIEYKSDEWKYHNSRVYYGNVENGLDYMGMSDFGDASLDYFITFQQEGVNLFFLYDEKIDEIYYLETLSNSPFYGVLYKDFLIYDPNLPDTLIYIDVFTYDLRYFDGLEK
ncbi:MAG: hypothetical protein AB7U79_02325 [Candidatus Izemoplasmatales bacterium]